MECNPVFRYAVVTDELTLYLRCLDKVQCSNGLGSTRPMNVHLESDARRTFYERLWHVNLPYSSFDVPNVPKDVR